MVKLGDICDIKSGGTPSRSNANYWNNGNIPWIKISDFNNTYIENTEEFITKEGLDNSSAKMIKKGSILFTIFATLGEVAILNIDATTNQAIASLTISDESVKQKYLYYFLCSLKDFVNGIGRGVAQNNINLKILKNISVPIPSSDKQNKIIKILDNVNCAIDCKKQQLLKLNELVKSRFIEMFGTYPLNSKGWNTCKIRDVVEDVRYGSSRPAVIGGKYPYLRMNNITYDGELDLTDIKYIDIPESELDKCAVRNGDVLFNRTNSRELVGKTCVYTNDEIMVLAGFIIRIRVNELVLSEFLSSFLNTDFSKQMLFNMCKTAIGQANINAQELQNIEIYLPPIKLQQEFVQFKKQIDKSKLAIEKSIEKLEILKKSLMQEYFG